MALSLWSLAAFAFIGSHALQVGLVGTCGQQPCVAAVESASVAVEIKGAIATTKLQQVFRGVLNSKGESKMKDTYFVFPIHAGAIVTGFTAEINGRFLQGKVMERHEAQQAYQTAIKESRCAALAQHGFSVAENGMDLYRISLGNLPTRQPALVNFSFVQELPLQDSDMKNQGFLRLLLPALVGAPSRYSPDDPSEKLLQAATHQAPSVKLAITIEPSATVSSPSHGELLSTAGGNAADVSKTVAQVEMRKWQDISKDFVLHIHFSQDRSLFRPRAVLEQHPKLKTWVAVAELVPRFSWDLLTNVEISILVDRSGSMQGRKELFARQALEHFVRSCPFQALVDIIGFGNSYEKLFPSPVQLEGEHFHTALAHARTLEANLGGTELARPLEYVLSRELKDGFHRRVLVLTDGEVWNTDHVISVAERCGARCELHTLGLGSGASTALLLRLARKGHGSAQFLADGEEEALQETVAKVLSAALQPPVTELQVHWPSSGSQLQGEETDAAIHSDSDGGIFQEGAVPSPSEILGQSSSEEKQKQKEEIRMKNVRRFSEQGGFQRFVQAGRLPRVRSGQRWSAYAFLGLMNDSHLPDEINMTGKMNGREFDLKLPVIRSNGTTLHALAAWHMSETLSVEGSWPELADGHGMGWEDLDWQIVALGITYGISTSKTSWIALDSAAKLYAAEVTSTPNLSPSTQIAHSFGSGLSMRSFARLGSTLSVLDFASLGSSLTLRSFCRLGSTKSVLDISRMLYGAASQASNFQDSTLTFARLGASQSIDVGLDVGQVASLPSSSVSSKRSSEVMYISLKISKNISVPIAMIHMANQSPETPSCSLAILRNNVTPMGAVLKNITGVGIGCSFPGRFGLVDLAPATDVADVLESIRVMPNCTLQLGASQPHIRLKDLNVSHLRSQLNQTLQLEPELAELLEMDVRKWGCPQMNRETYYDLLDSQRADGSFDWPVKFLQRLGHQSQEPVSSTVLPTAFAIAALRRCFPKWGALVEQKAFAWLRTISKSEEIDLWVSFANAAVLQRFMWKVHS